MIPRSARLGVLSDPGFRADLTRIARETGRSDEEAVRAARKYLREMVADPSPLVVGLAARAGRLLVRRNYRGIRHDPEELERVAELGKQHPLVVLPSHKSQLDHVVMHHLMWRSGHPPSYTASGINMNFFPVGPVLRRCGSFFIRRRIGERPIYKRVLRAYLAHLLEQGHPVEWYVEGTRSRTGKLLAPTFGLLAFAAEALWAGRCDDIYVVPASITYDHVEEIEPYVAEQRGSSKRRETFVWMIKSILMMGRGYGDIHVRFGRPLSMSDLFATYDQGDRRDMVAALGSEVCSRINEAAPVTAPSLVVSAILGGPPDAGLTMDRLGRVVDEFVQDAASRGLPTADALAGSLDRAGLERIVGTLARRGIATIDRGVPGDGESASTVRIEPGRRLAASFYRNTIAHHYVVPAAAETAIASARPTPGNSLLDSFHERLGALHGLLEAEFFLPDRESFVAQVTDELSRRVPSWEDLLASGDPARVMDQLRPHRAPWTLRHFLEAYLVVAEQLAEAADHQPSDARAFLRSALERSLEDIERGRMSPEAASLPLLSAGLKLAARQHPVAAGGPALWHEEEAPAEVLSRFLKAMSGMTTHSPATERLERPPG